MAPKIKVVTVYHQKELVHTNGIRRIVPTFIRFIDKSCFGKSKTVFTNETTVRFEVTKESRLFPYIPVRSAEHTGSACILNIKEIDFKRSRVKEYFNPIRKKMTIKTWYRREDCFKYLLTAGVGRDDCPRDRTTVIDKFNTWLVDHNYFKTRVD